MKRNLGNLGKRDYVIVLPKRQGYHFCNVLLATRACNPKSIKAVLHDGQMYIRIPDTRVTYTLWAGYIFGKKCGYWFGASMPAKGVGKVILPLKK